MHDFLCDFPWFPELLETLTQKIPAFLHSAYEVVNGKRGGRSLRSILPAPYFLPEVSSCPHITNVPVPLPFDCQI